MTSEIIVALMGLAGTLAGSFLGVIIDPKDMETAVRKNLSSILNSTIGRAHGGRSLRGGRI